MKKILAISVALLGSLAASQSVQAAAYAVSINSISNFSMTTTGIATLGGFTISNSMAAVNSLGTGGGRLF